MIYIHGIVLVDRKVCSIFCLLIEKHLARAEKLIPTLLPCAWSGKCNCL